MFGVIFLFLLAIALYVGFVYLLAKCVENPASNKKPFWWIFFFGLFGAMIYLLIDIRNITGLKNS